MWLNKISSPNHYKIIKIDYPRGCKINNINRDFSLKSCTLNLQNILLNTLVHHKIFTKTLNIYILLNRFVKICRSIQFHKSSMQNKRKFVTMRYIFFHFYVTLFWWWFYNDQWGSCRRNLFYSNFLFWCYFISKWGTQPS